MNIDTAQERDGGRVSSLAQQHPDKLKRGRGGGHNCMLEGDFGVSNVARMYAKQAAERFHLDFLKVFKILICLHLYFTFKML